MAESAVHKHMLRHRKPPCPNWRALLHDHTWDLIAIDLFVVPIVKSTMLFVLLVLHYPQRRVAHFGVTENPTAEWSE
jgi:hypothetical protein